MVKKKSAKKKSAKKSNRALTNAPSKKEKLRWAISSAMSDYSGDKTILDALLTVNGAKSIANSILAERKKDLMEHKKQIAKEEKNLKKIIVKKKRKK